MFTFIVLLTIFIVLALWFHGAIFLPDAELKNLHGFTFIYKEHQTSFNKLGPIYNKLTSLLKEKTKGLTNHIVSGMNLNYFRKGQFHESIFDVNSNFQSIYDY